MSKLIVMDANILIRGILGDRVPQLLEQYGDQVRFFTADVCYDEMRQHLPVILRKQGLSPDLFLAAIDSLQAVVLPLDEEVYGTKRNVALKHATFGTGSCWPWPLCWIVPSGQKTTTSLVRA